MSKETKPPVGRESDKFMLRLPEGMRERIAELAKQNGRSMNAEIVQRLEWALSLVSAPVTEKREPTNQPIAGALSWMITNEIKAIADREGVPFDEALAKIVMAGLHPDAPQVLYCPLMPGATKVEIREAMAASDEVARPGVVAVFDILERSAWAPEWMMERLKLIAQAAKQLEQSASESSKRPERIVRRPAPKKTTEK